MSGVRGQKNGKRSQKHFKYPKWSVEGHQKLLAKTFQHEHNFFQS